VRHAIELSQLSTNQFGIRRESRNEISQFIIIDVTFGFAEAFGKFIDDKGENQISQRNVIESH
jgi:hypothetical protein